MKVALVHDSFSEFGGAENVAQEIFNIFPNARVFTGYYQKEIVRNYFPNLKKNDFYSSWYQYFPRKTTTTIQFLSPLIWRFKNLKSFDLVITSSAYYLSPIATVNLNGVIHYLHTLPKNLFGLEKKSLWQKRLNLSYQKDLYLQSLKKGHLLVNSKNIQQNVWEKTGLESTVIYPPIKIPNKSIFKEEKKEYYLIVSRIDNTKSLEIAIKACNALNLPLKIAGVANNSSYLEKLKKMAGENVEFLGFVSDKERKKLYSKAHAFLFSPKNEDFGMAPVEAMAYGVPILAYYGGGVKETIIDGKTGVFFHQHSWQSMAKAIKKIRQIKFDRKILYNQAKRFSQERFKREFISYVKKYY